MLTLSALLVGCSRRAAETPLVEADSTRALATGEVVGFEGQYGSHVWLGIPYAAPPTGPGRWRAPAPAAPWTGVFEATRHGTPCPQIASRFAGVSEVPPGTPAGDEDCLTLDIYAPRHTADEAPSAGRRLPVMVWIHGGGNVIGHAGVYDGGKLAASQDVVVVVPQYRLGPLGWLRHESLRAAGASPEERSGNFGTLDLIHALEWVRDNIATFGGDPERVTIFGESAGGRNVFSLLVSPRAAGLFHRAIAQSGRAQTLRPILGERPSGVDDPAQAGLPNSSHEVLLRLLVASGAAPDRDSAAAELAGMAPSEIEAYLRGLHPFELLAVYDTEANEGLIDVPQLFADGRVIADEPVLERLAAPGGYSAVPAIFGTNRDEHKVFMYVQPRWVQQLLWVYPRVRDPQLYAAVSEAVAGAWKVLGADAPAAAIASHGASPVFVYRFDWDEEASLLGADLAQMLGASHGFEIPFVFGHFDLGEVNIVFDAKNEPGRSALSDQMMSYWAQFAYAGDPGRGRGGDLPEWRAWSAGLDAEPGFLVLDTPAEGGPRMSSDVLDEATVIARVRADPRLSSEEQRCLVLDELAGWTAERSGDGAVDRYAGAAAASCQGGAPAALASGG